MALKVRNKALKKWLRVRVNFILHKITICLCFYDKLGVIKSYEGVRFW
jgi:hypothetical protein